MEMSRKEQQIPAIRFNGFADDWEQRKLGDITTKIGSGKTPKGGNSVYVESGVPLLRSQNIYNDIVNFEEIAYITESMDKEMANSRVEKDDVLLNITGASIGRAAVYELSSPSNVNQHVCIIRPINEINSHYIQLNLTSPKGQKQIELNQAGGGREGLNFQQIAKMDFKYPTFKEQTKLGIFFKQLDETIALHQRQVDNYNELRKVILQKIFNQELRFKDQEGNDYPEWENTTLGNLSSIITKGTTPSSYDIEGTINFVKVESVVNERIDVMKVGKISQVINDLELKRSNLEENDLLISIAGTLGRSAIVQKEILPANTNQALAIVRLKPNNNVGYLACFINSPSIQDWIKKITTVGAQPNLSLQQVSELKIKIPCSEEQKKIADFLMSIDDRLNQYTQTVKLLEVQKKGLMQQMFL